MGKRFLLFRGFGATLLALGLVISLGGCGLMRSRPEVEITPEKLAVAEKVGLSMKQLVSLEERPTYTFEPRELDSYIKYYSQLEPDLRKRVLHYGRKNLGQPYEIYLLGEAPFEYYDEQPLYCLDRSDCVVFSEHTYAMALAQDWRSFMVLLQRIRYRNGEIGFTTRNHYTEADWDMNNAWLVEDLTDELVGEKAAKLKSKINRQKFFEKRAGIKKEVAVQNFQGTYIPADLVESVLPHLKDGDFVNVVRGTKGGQSVTHVGLIAHGEDGTVHFLHSTPPRVREEPIMDYVARGLKYNPERRAEGKDEFLGFKFLRLREDALENLALLDGPGGPKITIHATIK